MVMLVMNSVSKVRRMRAKLSSLPAIQRLMNFRLIACVLICFATSCSSDNNPLLKQCELELDSLETVLAQNPGFAASNTNSFMVLRERIHGRLDALSKDQTLSASALEQRDLLAIRSSVLFTAAMEQALELTRKQSDSLNKLRNSATSGN